MRAVIVYESMFGNTHKIAEAIAEGLASGAFAEVYRADEADYASLDGSELLVVGGPTHAWSMSRPATRRSAPGYLQRPGSRLTLEPGAVSGIGIREWLDSMPRTRVHAVAFDTRFRAPALLTGRASRRISRILARHGFSRLAAPKSFYVDRENQLLPGEIERAYAWGTELLAMTERITDRAR